MTAVVENDPVPCPARVTVASGLTIGCELEAGHDGEHRSELREYSVVWDDAEVDA